MKLIAALFAFSLFTPLNFTCSRQDKTQGPLLSYEYFYNGPMGRSGVYYKVEKEDAGIRITFSDQGYLLHGEGTVYSEPLITITGTGNITLMVNDTTVYLEDLEGSITLDCAAGIAYSMNDGQLIWAGEKVSLENGEWPTLKPVGNNNLFNWTLGNGASLSSITVQPNWRYL